MRAVFLFLIITFTQIVNAQICNLTITADAPNSRYIVNVNGTAIDKKTGLTWMRCALGQAWNGSSCTGSPQMYSWQTALQTANSKVFAGQSDWRLPNKQELQSLVENRCYDPTINLTIFPNTISSQTWSSSLYIGQNSYAWLVNFSNGHSSNDSKSNVYLVRLVRGG